MKKLMPILFLFILSSQSQASLYSQIDSCERNGGRSCIFRILRELAAQGRPNLCKCTAMKANSVRSQCFMKFESRLMIDGNTISLTCAGTKDQAFVNCMERRKKTDICFD